MELLVLEKAKGALEACSRLSLRSSFLLFFLSSKLGKDCKDQGWPYTIPSDVRNAMKNSLLDIPPQFSLPPTV